ncbi:MAG: helix-turn-helix transcriptional regulator [Oligoflexia bacterium]|nr:helix-turn-helix transcriptional regulator [Oligoflexia bacterium]
MKAKKAYRSAKPFFDKLLKDPEVRISYEEEKAKSKIAVAVKSARLHANLTQAQLAKKIGTTQSVIARLEGGLDKRVASLPLLARIAAACGAHLEFGFSFGRAS